MDILNKSYPKIAASSPPVPALISMIASASSVASFGIRAKFNSSYIFASSFSNSSFSLLANSDISISSLSINSLFSLISFEIF